MKPLTNRFLTPRSARAIFLAVGVALLALLSCNKGELNHNEGVSDKELSIHLNFSFADQEGSSAKGRGSATKAVADLIEHNTDLIFQSGHIIFCDDDGLIFKHIGIGNNAGSQQVSKAQLLSGVVIDGVATVADICIIVLNDVEAQLGGVGGVTGDLTGGNAYEDFLSKEVSVDVLNDPSGGVGNALILGGERVEILETPSAANGVEYMGVVEVEMAAEAGRFQIAKITAGSYNYVDGSGNPQVITIEAFTLDAIYLNSFFVYSEVLGGPHTLIDRGKEVDNYLPTADIYKAGDIGERLNDQVNRAAAGNPLTVYPTDPYNYKKRWAYNLFSGDVTPHFIIKLSDIKYKDSADDIERTYASRFLTVKGFTYGLGHPKVGQAVMGVGTSAIYSLNDLQFNYSHLTAIPYEDTIEATVTVTIMNWSENEIIWGN